MAECARGPACWARDSRCSAHQEHSRHQQVHGIEQTLRSSTAATAGRRSPAPPPAFVVATADALLPREAVARSRAPTGPRAQETAIGGRVRRLRGVAAAQAAARTVPLSTIRDTLYFLMLSCSAPVYQRVHQRSCALIVGTRKPFLEKRKPQGREKRRFFSSVNLKRKRFCAAGAKNDS